MPETILEYSSWAFQLVMVLAILYLVAGLIQPSWVLAARRSTVVAVSVAVMLLAATAFYFAIRPLPGALDNPAAVETGPLPPQPVQP